MGLFSNIYNTVAKFFRQQDEVPEGDASKSVATNRLKLVLMQDRTNLTPRILEQMRGELVDLLSKYLEMDKDSLELNFEQEDDQIALMLSIPVIRAKDEAEIEEALNAANSNDDDATPEDNEDTEYDNTENTSEENFEENEICDTDASVESRDDVEEVTEQISDEVDINNTEKTKRKQTKQMSNPQESENESEIKKEKSEEVEVVTD